MQKKLASLGVVLALVPSISLPARADLLKNFKTDGSIETRSFGISNETDRNSATDDYRSETHTRLMVGGMFDLLDDVHGRVLVSKNNRVYGAAAENANTVQSSLVLDNAYAKIDKVFGAVDLTMGRQFYGDNEDLNIYFGPQNDDLLSITSVDLFRADAMIANGWARFTGIAGKTADANVVAGAFPANTDTTLYGGEIGTDKLVPMGGLAVYYYTSQTHSTKVAPSVGNNTLSVGGLRLAGDILAGLGYHLEYLQNFGRNNTIVGTPAYHGNAYFANVHYGREFDGRPVRARLEYGRGSNDFRAIAAGRRFGIIFGEHTNFAGDPAVLSGRGQATGLSGLDVADLQVGVSPIAKLGIDFYAYRFLNDATGISPNGNRSLGNEYDLVLSWKHSENVTLEVNAATFQVGSALTNAAPTGTSPIERLGADVKIKF